MNPPLPRMPKKTKQYGWQCSECDKDPSEPFSFDQLHVDVEAPRASRKRKSYFGDVDSYSDFEMNYPQPIPSTAPFPPTPTTRNSEALHKKEDTMAPTNTRRKEISKSAASAPATSADNVGTTALNKATSRKRESIHQKEVQVASS